MIFHFQADSGTVFKDDHKAYFEERFRSLRKFMHNYEQERTQDTVEVRVSLHRNQHHKKGAVIESSATLFYPHHGPLHAEIQGENLKACADGLVGKLKPQIQKVKAHA